MSSAFRRILFDIETNGLLPSQTSPEFVMDRIHCIGIKCLDTGEVVSFASNEEGDDVYRGVEIVEDADYITGHNIIGFDLPALAYIFPDFKTDAKMLDTLVMSRMVFADQKEKDYRLVARKKLEGKHIGAHSLDAWGQRLGEHKGDYAKARKEDFLKDNPGATPVEIHRHVWGTWNPEMHSYMMQDLETNHVLWHSIEDMQWPLESIQLEHGIHALMEKQRETGFAVDRPAMEALADHLRENHTALSATATAQIGIWYRPVKRHEDNPDPSMGETDARRVWGNTTLPERTVNYRKSNASKAAEGLPLRASAHEGAAFVAVELKEFNPNSRPQIVDRLKTLYGWVPQDFTEKGSARVDDEILRNLITDIPLAETLAEVFYFKKRLGQVSDGQKGWLKLIRPDGRIHGRVNVGGAVSGRATHAEPNTSQVTGVTPVEIRGRDAGLEYIEAHADACDYYDRPIIVSHAYKEAKDEWTIYVRGRAGGHGWDSRECFVATPGYDLIGCDQSGVEFRCLANLTAPFDDGELIEIVLNGDIHALNAARSGIPRGIAKRALYACMYGGGDAMLGSIIEPLASEAKQRILGAHLRAKLMAAMPSLEAAIKAIKREKRKNRGKIRGLDGRWLYARSDHSVLNLRLQSDGAMLAKMWCLIVEDEFLERGWTHDVDGDFHFVNWSHDEIEVNTLPHLTKEAASIMEQSAALAGEHFNFLCPIAAEAKIGRNWAEVH